MFSILLAPTVCSMQLGAESKCIVSKTRQLPSALILTGGVRDRYEMRISRGAHTDA